MIKEIDIEVPAIAAYTKKNYKYYCDKCGKEIVYPGSLLFPTICYHDDEIDDVEIYEDRLYHIYYYHLCNDCIRKYIVNYLSEMDIKAYNQGEVLDKLK